MNNIRVTDHITRDPRILRGKPIICGTRVPVYLIVDFVANGVTPAQIVEDYPDLTEEDVKAALAFATLEAAELNIHAG